MKLNSENVKLHQKVFEKEIYIKELIDEMEEVNSVYKEFSNFKKITKDWEYQLRFKEEEIEKIKQELKSLDNCHSQSMDQLHQERIKHSSDLSSIEDKFENQKRKPLEQIRGLEDESIILPCPLERLSHLITLILDDYMNRQEDWPLKGLITMYLYS